jgi:DNA-binding transcriptional regulator YiaG
MAVMTKEEIKALRLKLNMTQQQFATMLYTGISTVFKWEKGTDIPRRMAMKRLEQIAAENK